MINEKLSSISREKVELEDILKNANTEFPNEEDVLELYKKYGAVFKETVVLKDVHVDDFEPEDRQDDGSNDRGNNVDAAKKYVGGDKVGENVDVAANDLVIDVAAKDVGVGVTKITKVVVEEPILSEESICSGSNTTLTGLER